ncbi:MAG: hypothetical protein JW841_16965 [Deltaproteobacteria bacterium]|nr:hypothetical protein [Deltaproteobacteria bacterium]
MAYLISATVITTLLTFYVLRLESPKITKHIIALNIALLVAPSTAVIAQGFTGLIYSLEILCGLTVIMLFSSKNGFKKLTEQMTNNTETTHAA